MTEHGREDLQGAALTPADAAALDALAEASWRAERVPGAARERATLLSRLVSLVWAEAPDDRDTLVGVTLARLEREGSASGREPTLTPMDAEALDAFVMNGCDASRVPASLRERAQRLGAFGAAIARTPAAGDSSALIERTLSALDRAAAERAASGAIAFVPAGRRARFADFVSIAAMFVIAAAVAWPVLSGTKLRADRFACAGNLRETRAALGSYAGDFRDSLPVTASFQGGTWWDVGTPQRSNSSNLYALVRHGYARLRDLACRGNPSAVFERADARADDWRDLSEVSYSYRVPCERSLVAWRQPAQAVVVADRSPVVLRAVRGEVIYPLENSPNHAGAGQTALRADGSAAWLTTPLTRDGDTLWLPRSIEDLLRRARALVRGRSTDPIHGVETPADRDDDFVGP